MSSFHGGFILTEDASSMNGEGAVAGVDEWVLVCGWLGCYITNAARKLS